MFSKITVIGIGVGGVITAIGVFAFITSLGIQTVVIDEIVDVGQSTKFQFSAPAHYKQNFEIQGDKFQISLSTPADGIQIPNRDFKNEASFEWVHLAHGESMINIQNTGDSTLQINGEFEIVTEPILFTYHILVITSGIVIVGFSAGFSIRKPKGF